MPTCNRHEQLRQPLYTALVDALLTGAAAYPEDFVDWEGAADDEDAFARFREQCLVDLLDTCYTMVAPPPCLSPHRPSSRAVTRVWVSNGVGGEQ